MNVADVWHLIAIANVVANKRGRNGFDRVVSEGRVQVGKTQP